MFPTGLTGSQIATRCKQVFPGLWLTVTIVCPGSGTAVSKSLQEADVPKGHAADMSQKDGLSDQRPCVAPDGIAKGS